MVGSLKSFVPTNTGLATSWFLSLKRHLFFMREKTILLYKQLKLFPPSQCKMHHHSFLDEKLG